IRRYSKRARVSETACPLFVPLVEEGWTDHDVTRRIAKQYLAPLQKLKLDTLVLGCTHYPLLKDTLKAIVGSRVNLIDSAEQTAKELEKLLSGNRTLNSAKALGQTTFYVTDHPSAFARLGQRFLGNRTPVAKR